MNIVKIFVAALIVLFISSLGYIFNPENSWSAGPCAIGIVTSVMGIYISFISALADGIADKLGL